MEDLASNRDPDFSGDLSIQGKMCVKRNSHTFKLYGSLLTSRDGKKGFYKTIFLEGSQIKYENSSSSFEIITDEKMYHFKPTDGKKASTWVKHLSAAIQSPVEKQHPMQTQKQSLREWLIPLNLEKYATKLEEYCSSIEDLKKKPKNEIDKILSNLGDKDAAIKIRDSLIVFMVTLHFELCEKSKGITTKIQLPKIRNIGESSFSNTSWEKVTIKDVLKKAKLIVKKRKLLANKTEADWTEYALYASSEGDFLNENNFLEEYAQNERINLWLKKKSRC